MESENDEEVRAILEAYSRYNISEEMCKDLNIDASYGHILSWTNVKTVMCSGRNATFILPEKTWLRCFGRLVKPNAKPFFINVPSNKNWKGKWKNQTALPYTYTDPKDGTTKTVNISSTEDILNILREGNPNVGQGSFMGIKKLWEGCTNDEIVMRVSNSMNYSTSDSDSEKTYIKIKEHIGF